MEYPRNTVWYIEARPYVAPPGFAPVTASMGSAVVVQLETFKRDGSPHDPPRVRKYLLTCGHLVRGVTTDSKREKGWGPLLTEIICFQPGRGYLSTRANERRSTVLDGTFFARVHKFSPHVNFENDVPETDRRGTNDWVLLDVEQPEFQDIPVTAKLRATGKEGQAVHIAGYPGGNAGWKNLTPVECGVFSFKHERTGAHPGMLVLDGSETREGMSGGGVFSDVSQVLLGLHRSSKDPLLAKYAVAVDHILAELWAKWQVRPVAELPQEGSVPAIVFPLKADPCRDLLEGTAPVMRFTRRQLGDKLHSVSQPGAGGIVLADLQSVPRDLRTSGQEVYHDENCSLFIGRDGLVVGASGSFRRTFGSVTDVLLGRPLNSALAALGLQRPPIGGGAISTTLVVLPNPGAVAASYDWLLRQAGTRTDVNAAWVLVAKQRTRPASYFAAALTHGVAACLGPTNSREELNGRIARFVTRLPGRAHFKEGEGLLYRYSNKNTLRLLGLAVAEELWGKDDYKLAKLQGKRWPATLADQLRSYDQLSIASGMPLLEHTATPYFDAKGVLVQHSLSKIPIHFGDEPVGIITLAIDRHRLLDPRYLRRLFGRMLCDKKKAHELFIRHLGFPDVEGTISPADYDVLFHLARGACDDELAAISRCTKQEIDARINALKAKLCAPSRDGLIDYYYSTVSIFSQRLEP